MKSKSEKSPAFRRPAVVHRSAPPSRDRRERCPIVGVGASAGGLEAFTRLLKRLPADTGLGFVLVQHLDPQHESALTQLLARATAMPVREVTNNLRVEANHVYVIPPNTSLAMARGFLKLLPRPQSRVAPRSIDSFLESLAKDQQERAIGVILSGTASDGTLGLEAIKAEGGLTFAQDDTARYNSMPRSAVAAGCVDFVLSPENIAKELARIARHPYVSGRVSAPPAGRVRGRIRAETNGRSEVPGAGRADPPEQDAYERILLLLRNHSGVDFSLYKTPTIHRRIARRTVLSQQQTLAGYADSLRGNTRQLDALYADALINVTSFFRNPEAFDVLRQKVFPRLLQQGGSEPLRIWVLGCSTGQEAYSVAMAYTECAEQTRHPRKLQVFATDLNQANLDRARHAHYPRSIEQDVSPERLRRFFTEEEGGYRVVKPLRESVVFARQNLISDPPFSRMDLICCRNLMIYLEPSLQRKLLPTFHYALKPEGFLFLGASESIGGSQELFSPVDKKQKVFVRKAVPIQAFHLPVRRAGGGPAAAAGTPRVRPRTEPGPVTSPNGLHGEPSAEREADRVTVNQFAPPGVLVNADLQILQFRGPTGAFLESPTGKATFDLLKMARDGLMLPLRATLLQAKQENRAVRKEDVLMTQNGRTRAVSLEVVPLKNLKERCFLVLFEDGEKAGRARPAATEPPGPAAKPPPAEKEGRKDAAVRIAALERDLAEARDYLTSVEEEQEAANEEIQAAHEESQSANEELQSLNEELETSKEELESTNEELTTVNEEMINRNNELNRLNSDLTNLQTSTKLVIVLLGRDLAIRRFSVQAGIQFHLVATDVGRPFGNIRHRLDLPDLAGVISGVIARERECEREVQDQDGHWYSLKVRPCLTLDNKVDGAVFVLVDINAAKEAGQEVARARDFAEAIIGSARDPLLILDSGLRVEKANRAFLTTFKVSSEGLLGRTLFEVNRGHWNVAGLRKLLKGVLAGNGSFSNFEITGRLGPIGLCTLLLNARVLSQADGHREKILLGIQDVTERKRKEEALRVVQGELSQHAGQLDRQVGRRTAELTAANRRLEASVVSLSKSREEFRAIYLTSQFMQKKLRLLARQILSAQEDERRKISRELHDEVVQTLVGINVALAALGRAASLGPRALQSKIGQTQRLVEKSVDAVHRFARELRPAALDDLGLIPALHAYMKLMATRHRLKIHLTAFAAVETLDNARRTVLYRMAQEALTNVARHAHASVVKIRISRIAGAVRMSVHDNGRSFEVAQKLSAKTNQRLGLLGMRERVEMVGGTLLVESARGHGTTLRAEIPFRQGGAA